MRKTLALLVVALLVASSTVSLLPVKAQARTIVVPDDYSTISMAIARASDGDSIFVKSGTYKERLVIDKALSLRGEGTGATVINGDNEGTVVVVSHDNVEFTGFSVIYDETPNTPKSLWMWSTRLIGIHLLSVKNSNIYGNKITDCGAGIWLYNAHDNRIADNSISSCDYGLRVEGSTGNRITENSLTGNWGGLWLLSSTNNKLTANTLSNNVRNFGVAGSEISDYINDVDTTNTVNSKPIYYWIGKTDQTVPLDAGCVILANCKNIIVQDLSLSNVKDAVLLAHCYKTAVKNNDITDCDAGITLFNSTLDIIERNDIKSPVGISASANGTKILGNVINATGTGIYMEGNYQTANGNRVKAGTFGAGNKILECKGSYNNISQNTLNGESYVGVLVEGSHNFLFENTVSMGGARIVGESNIVAKNTITYESLSISGGPNNIICGNTILNGYDLGVSGQGDTYYANHVETNGLGARIGGTETRVYGNVLYHNNFIISTRNGPVWGDNKANSWDNGQEGNYWSDYNGSDWNFDGKGDTPYAIMSETLGNGGAVDIVIGYDNHPLMAPFDISSVEVPVWEMPPWAPEEFTIPSDGNETEETPTSTDPSTSPSSEPNNGTKSDQSDSLPESTDVAVSLTIIVGTCLGLLFFYKKGKQTLHDKRKTVNNATIP